MGLIVFNEESQTCSWKLHWTYVGARRVAGDKYSQTDTVQARAPVGARSAVSSTLLRVPLLPLSLLQHVNNPLCDCLLGYRCLFSKSSLVPGL